MKDLPEPTNQWTRAEMVGHLIYHLHEATQGLAKLPDYKSSIVQNEMVSLLLDLREESRDKGYWQR